MSKFRVFLGAPTRADVSRNGAPSVFSWTSFTNRESHDASSSLEDEVLLPATIEQASLRLAGLYEGVIFAESQEEDETNAILELVQKTGTFEETIPTERSIAVTDWPPTAPPQGGVSRQLNVTESLMTESSVNETREDSSSSSIGRFPTFHINLHTVTSLTAVSTRPKHYSAKVNILVSVLEAEGLEVVKIRKGKDAGKEVALLKLVVGDEEGRIAKITAWRETAEMWSGLKSDEGVRKGDTVFLENLSVAPITSAGSLSFTASPSLRSSLHICYRSLPQAALDRRFRPDLRLGMTDAGVRRVAQLVSWIERMAGIGT